MEFNFHTSNATLELAVYFQNCSTSPYSAYSAIKSRMLKESPRPIFRSFSVECKETKSRRPSVVIATCKTKANRDEILSAKQMLQLSRQYSDVSLQQGIESENMCILVKTLCYVNPDLYVRGRRSVDFSARQRPWQTKNHDRTIAALIVQVWSRRYNDRTSHRPSRDNTDERYNSSEFQRSRR